MTFNKPILIRAYAFVSASDRKVEPESYKKDPAHWMVKILNAIPRIKKQSKRTKRETKRDNKQTEDVLDDDYDLTGDSDWQKV